MRKKLLTLLLLLPLSLWVQGQISTFPYNENFETFTTCATSCASVCGLSNGWSNPTGVDQADWSVDVGGTPSFGTGPTVDHNPGNGTGKYLYTEASGCSNNAAYLVSPYFNFTGIEVELEFWYHMFGTSMGTMHIDVDTTQGLGAWVLDVVPSWTDNQDVWQRKNVIFCGFGNRDSVRFRIRGIMGTSFESDMAVDDVTVRSLPNIDVTLENLSSPVSGCGLGTEMVSVCLRNAGAAALAPGTVVPVAYSLNNGTPTTQNLTLASGLAACDSVCFTFSTGANLSVPNTYALKVWTALATDPNVQNDTLYTSIISIPLVSSLPYFQDFESGNGGYTSSGNLNSWQFGTPAGTFITGAASGVNAWVTNLTGSYNDNELSYLQSACLDFSSAVSDPFIRFSHIFSTESCCDEGWLEVSTNGGGTWAKVGTFGTGQNWYNNSGSQWWNGNSGNPGAWRVAQNTLTGTAGQSSVLVRWVFSSDGSVVDDGFGVDDVIIYNTLTDGTVSTLTSPVSNCGLTSSETITVLIGNNGTTTINDATLCYTVNGGSPVCQTVTSLGLAPGASQPFTFTTGANLSTPGTYTIDVYISVVGENFASNDTLTASVQHIPTVSALPYFEDFENGNGFWQSGGSNSSWAWGMPTGTVIGQNGSCGTNIWATNLGGAYNNSEDSWIQSPCMDFTSISGNAYIRFDHNYDTETFYDETWLEYSTNNGATWTKVGASGSGTNWYNNGTGQYWEGSSNGWRSAEHLLPSALNGQSQVYLRFFFNSDGSVTYEGVGIDNILIYQTLNDASTISLDGPSSACGLTSAETVSATFQNTGSVSLSNINVCFVVDNGSPICEVIPGPVAAGNTISYTFTGTADLSTIGDHYVTIYTSLAGDNLNCSDTVTTLVSNRPTVSTFPYLEKFENGSGGWVASGVNNSWVLGTPNKAVIIGAASGVNAWVTGGLTGLYPNDENSNVEGPCFDFTFSGMTNPWVALSVWWESENTWDGANVQYSLDSGANWITIGAFGDPNNWYTNAAIFAAPGGDGQGWTGEAGSGSGGWLIASHPLDTAILGEPSVKFRVAFASDNIINADGFAFDNFAIAEPPMLSLGPDTTVCGGYTLSSGYGAGTFEWSTGESTSSIVLLNTSSTVRTDTISIIYTDTFGLMAMDTVIINVDPAAVVDLGADTTICYNASITLDAGGSGTYAWSNGPTSQTINVTSAGTYSVTVTNGVSGCATTDDIVVGQTTAVTVSQDTSICSGGSAMLMADIAVGTYVWSTGDSTQSITVNAAGTYTVTVTDGYGCVSTDDAVVTLIPDPSASFNFTVGGAGLDYSFNDQSSGNPTTWSWTFGDGNSSSSQNPTHTYAANGNYDVTLVVTNQCGSDSMTMNLTVVGISTVLGEGMVSIYPNPNRGTFQIAIRDLNADVLDVRVVNAVGQVVWSAPTTSINGSSLEKYDLSGLSKGLYFVQITADGKSVIQKVVVE